MPQEDYYGLLGVSRSATRDALKRAFRNRVIAVHPDHRPHDLRATEQTRKLIEAYQTLSDPASRRNYDVSLGAPSRTTFVPKRPTAPPYVQAIHRFLRVACAVILLIGAALLLAQVILADQEPGYKAHLYSLEYTADGVPLTDTVPVADTRGILACCTQRYPLIRDNAWPQTESPEPVLVARLPR